MPLVRSGLALASSSVITSALGFVFWVVAARQFTAAEVGVSSALISTMVVLSDFAHLGLRTGLAKFLPTAGPGQVRLILTSYAISVAMAVVLASAFVFGIGWWTPELDVVRSTPWAAVAFVAATAGWVLFLLEDSALLGVRLAPWVPVENGAFGLAKIVLLFPLAALAGASGQLGVFLAWSLPVFVVAAVVNWLMIRVLRARPVTDASPAPPVRLGQILSYSGIDWTASVIRTTVSGVLPLIVLSQLGSEASAYYWLAWTISHSIYFLAMTVGDALLVEASYDEVNVDRHTLHGGLLSMAISVPIVIVAIIAAPLVLGAFGAEYTEAATTLLRILMVAAIPNVIVRTYVGRLRAERRMVTALVFEAAIAIGVLVAGSILLQLWGLNGVGVAWLVLFTLGGLYVLAVESQSWWAHRIDSRVVRAVRRAQGWLEPLRLWRPFSRSNRAIGAILPTLYHSVPAWSRLVLTDHSQVVAVAGHEGRPPLWVEVARSDHGAQELARRVEAVSQISRLSGVPSFVALVPYPIEHHRGPGRAYVVESAVSGRPGRALRHDVGTDVLVAAVVDALSTLHHASAGRMVFDADNLEHWVSEPLRTVGEIGRIDDARLADLGQDLVRGLDGREATSARIHGSLSLDNTLFDPTGRLTGIVDWERSQVGPTFLDWGTLALSALTVELKDDLGPVTVAMLEDPDRFMQHPALAASSLPEVEPRILLMMAWLHAIQGPLVAASSRTRPRFWLARNITPVLDHHLVPTSVAR